MGLLPGKKRRWRVVWLDGSVVESKTATGVLLEVAKTQPEPCSIPELKQRLRSRAWTWNRAVVDAKLEDKEFLWDLASWGLVKIQEMGKS